MVRAIAGFTRVGLCVGIGAGIGLSAGAGGLAFAAHPLPPRLAAPAPPPRPAAPPPPVALPVGPAGCTLRATKPRDTVTLEIAAGVPYARVAEIESLEAKLPVGRDAPPAGVQLVVGNVRLRGLAAPSGLAIYPARPFVINEVLLPGPGSRLRWGDVAADRVAVALELAKENRGDVRDVKGSLRTTRPCADLRLTGRASFDSYAAVGGRGADHVAGLKSSAPVPISAQPKGPTLAKLVVSRKASLNEVTVIDEDAGWTRIGRPAAGDLLVVGWVKQAKLGKPPARDTTFALFGEAGARPSGSADADTPPTPPFACAKELPLVAEVGQQRRTVGTIGSGVRMRASPADADHVAIVFADRAEMNVRPVAGARLLVRRSDFDGCPGFPRR